MQNDWKNLLRELEAFNSWLLSVTSYINTIAKAENCDFVKTAHYKQREEERQITILQVLHILKTGEAVRLQKTTRKKLAKVGITGEDFDGKGIMVVVVPGQKGIKLITAFYT